MKKVLVAGESMKKVLVALAVLALAGAAQAAVIATWTTTSALNLNSGDISADGPNTYGFALHSMGGFNGTSAPAGGTIAVGGADAASRADAITDNQYITFTWNTSYTLTLDSIAGFMTRSGTGATTAQFGTYIGTTWTDLGAAITVSSVSGTAAAYSLTGLSGTAADLESGELALAAYGGSASTSTAWFRPADCRPTTTPVSGLTLDGTMTAIPEPMTMALLGLGGVAIALRRKLSK